MAEKITRRTFLKGAAAAAVAVSLAGCGGGSTGIIWQGTTKDCDLEFTTTDKALYEALRDGVQTLDLTITLSTVSRLFVLDLKNKTVTPQ